MKYVRGGTMLVGEGGRGIDDVKNLREGSTAPRCRKIAYAAASSTWRKASSGDRVAKNAIFFRELYQGFVAINSQHQYRACDAALHKGGVRFVLSICRPSF
ncbi:hypothetical protein [Novosphingobium sp. AP12]|uniref:hypothetical protein n=1 Tax=Novosphingobium sp. AP12 TaxID=1144305 RepID=UPI0012FC4B4C|nr:hypothetical protein [Novosphingobium sp. AP12]